MIINQPNPTECIDNLGPCIGSITKLLGVDSMSADKYDELSGVLMDFVSEVVRTGDINDHFAFDVTPAADNEDPHALSHEVSIVVPSTVSADKTANHALVNEMSTECKHTYSRIAGGFTSVNARGGWVSAEHGLIEEDVEIVSCVCSAVTLRRVTEATRELAEVWRERMTQEAIMIRVDGVAEFI